MLQPLFEERKSFVFWTVVLIGLSTSWSAKSYDKVVYGPDNRVDVQDSPSPAYREWARSTAAMIANDRLIDLENGLFTQVKADRNPMRVCAEESFSNQVMVANCTGFLLGPDLLVTAGHCYQSDASCANFKWVFDFKTGSLGTEEMPLVKTSNVYGCKEIVSQKLDMDTKMDYAVIRLDRKVKDRNPLTFRREGAPKVGEEMVVIGHPSGLPTKVADGALVRKNEDDSFFVVNADTFQGNSGSPVFNASTGKVEGILVRGESDYVYDFEKHCYNVRRCGMDECRGEDVTRITKVPSLPKADDTTVADLSEDKEDEGTLVPEVVEEIKTLPSLRNWRRPGPVNPHLVPVVYRRY